MLRLMIREKQKTGQKLNAVPWQIRIKMVYATTTVLQTANILKDVLPAIWAKTVQNAAQNANIRKVKNAPVNANIRKQKQQNVLVSASMRKLIQQNAPVKASIKKKDARLKRASQKPHPAAQIKSNLLLA
jgi:hypothetical protein